MKHTVEEYKEISKQARLDIIEMSFISSAGHVPSALSMVDYLNILLDYYSPLECSYVLGKPFGAQAYYSLFASRGWIEKKWEQYCSSSSEWSYIMSTDHPLIRFADYTMGNALGVACGIAMSQAQMVVVNTSDASVQCGIFWEAVQFAGFHFLSNLILIIDHNDMQVQGNVSNICEIEPIEERFNSFGWRSFRSDGHDIIRMINVLNMVLEDVYQGPKVLIFDTKKGKGVSFMENNREWHYKAIDEETRIAAIKEIENEEKA